MNSNELLKKLPDFDDFEALIDEIRAVYATKLTLDITIKAIEADIVKTVTTDVKYFQAGKQPSMNFIDSVYRHSGLNGELLPMRNELANLTAQLEGLRNRLDVYKNLLEMWRTLSANERKAVI